MWNVKKTIKTNNNNTIKGKTIYRMDYLFSLFTENYHVIINKDKQKINDDNIYIPKKC